MKLVCAKKSEGQIVSYKKEEEDERTRVWSIMERNKMRCSTACRGQCVKSEVV